MSKIGKLPIVVPKEVNIVISGSSVRVQGPFAVLQRNLSGVTMSFQDNMITVAPLDESSHARAMWGTARSIIYGMVEGAFRGYKVSLELVGVGYKAMIKGSFLFLTLGKSHGTMIEIPEGVKVVTPTQDSIELQGADKQSLGDFAALIKSQRRVEPYKGRGIKLKGEFVVRKEGKKG